MKLTSFFNSHFSTETIALHDGGSMPVTIVGQGEPVVLLHGFGMEASAWLPFVLPLSNQFRFYLPTLRAFGKASKQGFSQPDFIADYVADIVAMREQLGLTQIRLGGISMGALTCLALHHAGKFDGVTHLLHIDQSPVMHNTTDWPWGLMGDSQTAFFHQLASLVEVSTPHLDKSFAQLPHTVKHALISSIATMIGTSFENKVMQRIAKWAPRYPSLAGKVRDTSGWQNQLHIVQGYLDTAYDFREPAAQIDIPVTVVIGAASRLYDPAGQRQFARILQHAQVIELADTGHATLLDSPVASYQAIKEFVQAK